MRRSEHSGRMTRAVLVLLGLAVLLSACPRKGDYIGTFDMSHYCLETWAGGGHICGNSQYGSGGDRIVPEKSLAVPASVLEKYPVGTRVMAVYPDGKQEVLTILDTGSALERLSRIDMPVKTHKRALELGVIEGVKLYTVK